MHDIKQKKDLWTGRVDTTTDPLGFRWHQCVQTSELNDLKKNKNDHSYVILGFECDEGVKRNHGRVGAAKGPNQIRKALSSLPFHSSKANVFDVGNIDCLDQNLESSQLAMTKATKTIHDLGYKSIALGGGHEMAYGHALGLLKQKMGIINFDAHFDLRQDKYATSGTPFLQLAKECKKQNIPFNYLCLGIQKASNTQLLFNTAKNVGAKFIEREQLTHEKLSVIQTQIDAFVSQLDVVYITICLDVFDSAFAPGVSAPCTYGLTPDVFFPIFNYIIASSKLKTQSSKERKKIALSIAELAPCYDQDNRTAKLAARIVNEFVTCHPGFMEKSH